MLRKGKVNRKAMEMSLSIVIIAVILLLVLVVLGFIFAKGTGNFQRGIEFCAEDHCVIDESECKNLNAPIATPMICKLSPNDNTAEGKFCCRKLG